MEIDSITTEPVDPDMSNWLHQNASYAQIDRQPAQRLPPELTALFYGEGTLYKQFVGIRKP